MSIPSNRRETEARERKIRISVMFICGIVGLIGVLACGYGHAALSSDLTISGEAVVQKVETAFWSNYIQDVTATECQAVSLHAEKTVRDRRDNTSYRIKKMADGNCWMVDNLALKLTTSGLTTAYTDITSNWNSRSTYKPTKTYTSITKDNATDTTATDVKSWIDATSGAMYYTFNAATAGNGGKVTADGVIVEGSICPKGWKLPLGGEAYKNASGSWHNLFIAYGMDERTSSVAGSYEVTMPNNTVKVVEIADGEYSLARSDIFYFNYFPGMVRSVVGTLLNNGTTSYYWTAVSKDSNRVYGLDFTTTTLKSSTMTFREYGQTVRCVLRN